MSERQFLINCLEKYKVRDDVAPQQLTAAMRLLTLVAGLEPERKQNKKSQPKGGSFCFWLPLLDSNQLHVRGTTWSRCVGVNAFLALPVLPLLRLAVSATGSARLRNS